MSQKSQQTPKIIRDYPDAYAELRKCGVMPKLKFADHDRFPTLVLIEGLTFTHPRKGRQTPLEIRDDMRAEVEAFVNAQWAAEESVDVTELEESFRLGGEDKNLFFCPTEQRREARLYDEFDTVIYPACSRRMRIEPGSSHTCLVAFEYSRDKQRRWGKAMFAEPELLSADVWLPESDAAVPVVFFPTTRLIHRRGRKGDEAKVIATASAFHPSAKRIEFEVDTFGEPPYMEPIEVKLYERRNSILAFPAKEEVTEEQLKDALARHEGDDLAPDETIWKGQVVSIWEALNDACKRKKMTFTDQMAEDLFNKQAKSLRRSEHPDKFQGRPEAIIQMRKGRFQHITHLLTRAKEILEPGWEKDKKDNETQPDENGSQPSA